MIRFAPIRRAATFLRDRKGVAAVEFALILPVLIASYVGVAELANAMMAQRRVSHSASALGDMVTQYQSIQKSNTTDIFNAASLIMAPFNTSPLSLRITEFTYSASGKATINWTVNSGPSVWTETYKGGNTITSGASAHDTQVTTLLTQSGQSIVLSEAQYTYNSPISDVVGAALPNVMTFNDAFYLAPRSGTAIACSDC